MFTMSLYRLIRTIVDQEMERTPGDIRSSCAFVVAFDLRMDNFSGKGKHASRRETVHFLFQRPHDSRTGSTHTFFAIGDANTPVDKLDWEFLSSHDSCWIDAVSQEISKIYFRMADEVETASGVGIAPCELSESADLALFCKPFQWVRVSIEKDLRDEFGYKKFVSFPFRAK